MRDRCVKTGLLLAVPYGLMADKHGRKIVLCLCIFGLGLGHVFYVIVCKEDLSSSIPKTLMMSMLTSARLVASCVSNSVNLALSSISHNRWRRDRSQFDDFLHIV